MAPNRRCQYPVIGKDGQIIGIWTDQSGHVERRGPGDRIRLLVIPDLPTMAGPEAVPSLLDDQEYATRTISLEIGERRKVRGYDGYRCITLRVIDDDERLLDHVNGFEWLEMIFGSHYYVERAIA